jgi:hypothetical protein
VNEARVTSTATKRPFSTQRVVLALFLVIFLAVPPLAVYFGAKPLGRYIMNRIDETYQYQIAPGYFISGHRYIEDSCQIAGGSGVRVPNPDEVPKLVLREFAVTGPLIVGRTTDIKQGSWYFIIDTREAVVHYPLTPTAYSEMLAKEGVASPPTLEQPDYSR